MMPRGFSSRSPALAVLVACLIGSGIAAADALAASAAPSPDPARAPTSQGTPQTASNSRTSRTESVNVRTIRTAPPVPGLHFVFGGTTFVTDKHGEIVIPRNLLPSGATNFRQLFIGKLRLLPLKRGPGTFYRIERFYGRRVLRVAVKSYLPVRFAFVDRFGHPVDLRLLGSMTIKRSDGVVITLQAKQLRKQERIFQASRVVPLSGALVSKQLDYRIQSVLVGGNNVVNRAQQAFTPLHNRHVSVRLLFYSARVSARDALFGFGIGSGILLEYPDGRVQHHAFPDGHRLRLPALPRGAYHISVDTKWGRSGSQPVAITRDQVVQLKVLSYFDIATGAVLLIALAFGLVAIGRGRHRASERRLATPPAPTPAQADIAPWPMPHEDGA